MECTLRNFGRNFVLGCQSWRPAPMLMENAGFTALCSHQSLCLWELLCFLSSSLTALGGLSLLSWIPRETGENMVLLLLYQSGVYSGIISQFEGWCFFTLSRRAKIIKALSEALCLIE